MSDIDSDFKNTLFRVTMEPVPHPVDDHNTKYRYIMRTDNNEVLSIVTKDYTLVPNEKLMSAIMPTIKEHNGELLEATMFGDGARTMYRFRFNENKVIVNGNDELIPEIIIKNSYDGSTAITVMAGAFRMVCTNGMIVGKIVDYFKNRHLTDVDINKLNTIITSTIDRTIHYLSEKVAKLAEIKVKEQHILDMIQMFPERMMEYAMQYMTRNRPQDYWDLLNSATYIATHNMNREAESTHNLEKRFLPTVMKMANLK